MGVVQQLVPEAGFTEVADRIWVARHTWLDVNVSVIGGDRGLVVVDTHSSDLAARGVLACLQERLPGEVLAVVNTHEHFDHTFGNVAFHETWPAADLVAHETAAERTVAAGERIKGAYRDEPDDPHAPEALATPILAATTTFSSVHVLDLGDRVVELLHPGRGHTGGDLVVRVGDADVLLTGDLVEQSDRDAVGGMPGFGGDCYPLEWPATLDLVLELTRPGTRVVPGHGSVVDPEFVRDQRSDIGIVAETIRDLVGRGVPVEDALAQGDWPYPADRLAEAVRRGYAVVPPPTTPFGAPTLPLA